MEKAKVYSPSMIASKLGVDRFKVELAISILLMEGLIEEVKCDNSYCTSCGLRSICSQCSSSRIKLYRVRRKNVK